jgi:hypothetical protein
MTTSTKMTVIRDVATCCLVDIDRRFSGGYCLHHEDDGSVGNSSEAE